MMRTDSVRTFGLAMGLCIAANSAALASTKPAVLRGTPTTPAPAPVAVTSAAEFDKLIAEAEERGNRKPAAAPEVFTEKVLSETFRTKIRNRALAITTPAALHAFLKDMDNDKYYADLKDADAQFAAAQIAPMIVFNGFFNRAITWIKSSRVSHLSAVSMLRSVGAGVMIYSPTAQSETALAYLTVPSDTMGADIAKEADFHTFLETELVPALAKARNRIKALNFAAKPVYFDNQILYGPAKTFFHDRDHFVRMGEAERHAVLANLYYTLSSVESLTAYNLDGIFEAVDGIARNFGLGSAILYEPSMTVDKKRFDVIRAQNRKTGLFNLRAGGQDWMNHAYDNLSQAVVESTISWRELRARTSDADSIGNLLDPSGTGPINRMMTTGLHNLTYIATENPKYSVKNTYKDSDKNAPEGVQSVVSGEGRTVRLRTFYTKAPDSLVELMPTEFDPGKYNQSVKVNGKKRDYHNFLAGRASGWNLTEYQKMFPEIKSNDDVKTTARILSQSWGGWLVGVPMASLIL